MWCGWNVDSCGIIGAGDLCEVSITVTIVGVSCENWCSWILYIGQFLCTMCRRGQICSFRGHLWPDVHVQGWNCGKLDYEM